ncbi:MAG: hypothetical protein II983_04460 [Firmicutes bacterium]|nr:hypothetical protein [Bacillota bacterium]MBQ6686383.1 hypothetical protein [Bacillota bacterium]
MEWELIAGILGAIVLIGNAGAIVMKWIRPALDTKQDLEKVKREIEEIKKHEKQDLEAIKQLQEMNKLQCRAMLCIINHMIDGNGIVKMQETRDDIQDLLIEQ